jgi:hypothetical protein
MLNAEPPEGATAQKATLSRGQSLKVDQSPADQTEGLMSQWRALANPTSPARELYQQQQPD